MGVLILIVMIGTPLAEIAVFIEVGEKIGLGPTLIVVVLTAIIGTALLRHQGFSVLSRARDSLRRNRVPMNELFDGLCLLFAGALLLTPGFVTDTAGFLLFMPPFRALLKIWAGKVLIARGRVHADGAGYRQDSQTSSGPVIIDGEFSDITPGTKPADGNGDDRDGLPPPP